MPADRNPSAATTERLGVFTQIALLPLNVLGVFGMIAGFVCEFARDGFAVGRDDARRVLVRWRNS